MRCVRRCVASGLGVLMAIAGVAALYALFPTGAGASLVTNPTDPVGSALFLPTVASFPYAQVNGVACLGSGSCFVVGTASALPDLGDPSADEAVLWEISSAGISAPTVLSSGTEAVGITCSGGTCYALGTQSVDGSGKSILFFGPNFQTEEVASSVAFTAMDCDQIGLCLIAGNSGSTGEFWQFNPATDLLVEVGSEPAAFFTGVGCSAASCVAVGTSTSSSGDIGVIATPNSGTVLSVSGFLYTDVSGTTTLSGIQCATSCVAVGSYVDLSGVSHGVTVTLPSLPFTNPLSAGAWIDEATVQYSGGASTSGLETVDAAATACPSVECYIGGALNSGNGYIASMSGGVPGELIDLGPDTVVNAVACEGASRCYAGGAAPNLGIVPAPTLWSISSVPNGGSGYWLASGDGNVAAFGSAASHALVNAQHRGQAPRDTPTQLNLNSSIVGIAATPDKGGYWLAGGDGGIFAYGDAPFYGSMGGKSLAAPVVGLAATPDGRGYWEVASDGGVFSFGDAQFEGSTGSIQLNQPVVGMAATSNGRGYWLVAKDGGVFAFGDAEFFGSMGDIALNAPVIAMVDTPDDGGYLLVAKDGGIFAFGDAGYFGSLGGRQLSAPVVAIASS